MMQVSTKTEYGLRCLLLLARQGEKSLSISQIADQERVPRQYAQQILQKLRRAGIVEREAEGVWRVPGDLAERGRQYDAQRLGGGVAVVATFTNTISSNTMVFTSTKVQFPRQTPTNQGRGEIFLPLQGVARKDGSTAELTVTLDSTP